LPIPQKSISHYLLRLELKFVDRVIYYLTHLPITSL